MVVIFYYMWSFGNKMRNIGNNKVIINGSDVSLSV